ncbi:T9SS sorting signal type C domain-containing protein [Flavobacterium sp. Sd200]|uniref:T9SS sorting signal type C domain-containing protein n=1 Tax=Flavobacterium sp. Sd200 TaxID=2692211 RepID=UPI00136B8AFF|nr:T9SS sorting signal type C domain-containing protein [Flavobacterium sp. Sd200]MXN91638.1 T9SS sorting signal type C domain-containing protein [Flavobacterium sp. Sd200]
MAQITPKTNFSIFSFSAFVMLCLFGLQANAQTCTPVGDQTSYGQGEWRGYVYSPISASGTPTATAFASANYKGYVTRTANFDQNIGDGALPSESTLCSGTYNQNFIIRYKMQANLAAGWYTYTIGGDDGYRLSLDGGANFPTNMSDWADHGFQSKTATYYHVGGVINMVLEYFEHGGASRIKFDYALASCTSTAPTFISGTATSSCSAGTTLTATGGLAGANCTYQWGVGSVVGENIIAGQTGVSITVQPYTTKTYWVRRVSAAPCSTTTEGITRTVTVATPAPGDPSAYGDNKWNVYGYRGRDLDFNVTTTEYAGYYSVSTLGFDTQTSWNKNSSPSFYASTNGYTGCELPIENFTFVHKRKGFTCGSYRIQMENWDDDSRLYINGVQVWNFVGYSGGQPVQNIGTFDLDANSTIELRVEENGGDANAKLVITPLNVSTAPSSISGVASCCQNALITLTATGGTLAQGAQYEWGTGAVGSNIIAGQTGATLTVVTTTTTTYWVRIKSACGAYTTAATKAVTVPAPLVYNNGWNGTPDINTAVEIRSNLALPQNLEVCSCQVKPNVTLTVPTGKTLTVKNKLTVEATGNVIVENNGALVQIEKVQDEGSIVVHKNSNPLYRLDYTMWSAPVTGQNLLAFSPQTTVGRFYEYKYDFDATANAYLEQYFIVDPTVNNFVPGKSYLIRMPNSNSATGYNAGTASITIDGTFTGVPNNADVSVPASTQGNRYTAVGNPYASPISVKDFFDQNSGVLQANSAIYLWRKRNNAQVSSYATITLAAFTKNSATGGGSEQGVYYTGSNVNWTLAQGQGFIVKTAASPTRTNILFTNSMRRNAPVSGNQSFFRTAQSAPSRLWLNLTGAENGFSQAAIAYMEEATTDLDYGYDGQQLSDGGLSIYSIAQETNLAIQARPEFTTTDVVALGYNAAQSGQYTISLDNVEGVFAEGQEIFIKDNVANTVNNITHTGYTFTTEAGTFNDRFEVVYAARTLNANTPHLDANSVIVYKNGNQIDINTGIAEMTDVNVYDIRGRKLYNKDNVNASEVSITGLQVSTEVLIVEINTNKGKVSKKIIF